MVITSVGQLLEEIEEEDEDSCTCNYYLAYYQLVHWYTTVITSVGQILEEIK
jgi:hypothetical protein